MKLKKYNSHELSTYLSCLLNVDTSSVVTFNHKKYPQILNLPFQIFTITEADAIKIAAAPSARTTTILRTWSSALQEIWSISLISNPPLSKRPSSVSSRREKFTGSCLEPAFALFVVLAAKERGSGSVQRPGGGGGFDHDFGEGRLNCVAP